MKKMRFLKSNKGITLIALVITIIVLIILVGIAVSLSVGNNGIINKAQNSNAKYIHSKVLEALKIEGDNYVIDSSVNKSATGDFFEPFDMYLVSKDKAELGINTGVVINVQNLLGNKEGLGNGDISEGYTDIYLLVPSMDDNFDPETFDVYELIYCQSEDAADDLSIGKLQFYKDGSGIILTPEDDYISGD